MRTIAPCCLPLLCVCAGLAEARTPEGMLARYYAKSIQEIRRTVAERLDRGPKPRPSPPSMPERAVYEHDPQTRRTLLKIERWDALRKAPPQLFRNADSRVWRVETEESSMSWGVPWTLRMETGEKGGPRWLRVSLALDSAGFVRAMRIVTLRGRQDYSLRHISLPCDLPFGCHPERLEFLLNTHLLPGWWRAVEEF